MRLAIATSHPIQYYAPLFAEIARRVELKVFFAHKASPQDQAAAGFGTAFDWDVNLTAGYDHVFLDNIALRPGVDRFDGCDTPEIGARLAEGGFDAVLVMGWRLKSSVQAIRAARALQLPVLMRGDSQLDTPRSLPKRLAKEIVYPFFLRQFAVALYVGQASRAYYEHYHYPKKRLFFSPHCVDTAWFADRATPAARETLRTKLGVGNGDKLVLFAGKLAPYKRPLDAIAAVAMARRQGLPVRLMVAGSGDLEPALKQRAAELDVPVHALGFQNQTAMPAAYAACDLLILPSDGRETWGLVCNEALACGRPILVSESAGCARDLATPGAGAVFPEGDTVQAARLMATLLTGGVDHDAIAARSAAYGLAQAADGIIDAMRWLADQRRTDASRLA